MLLSGAVEHLLEDRFKAAQKVLESTRKTPPQTADEVAEARERVNAEFAFIEYAEGIHAALKAEGHAH